MPIFGERKEKTMGQSYKNDPMYGLASEFAETAKNILKENGLNIFASPSEATILEASDMTLRNFFMENTLDKGSMSPEEYDDEMNMLNELYLNDREAIREYANIGGYNPIIGMSIPMHKNLLMNNIYDKGAIPKATARSPKFTLTMETRMLVTPDGREIDMFKEQMDMTAAIDATVPVKEIELTLPEYGQTDILAALGASSIDNLSIETHISALKIRANVTEGQKLPDGTVAGTTGEADVWIPVKLKFTPGYGELERSLVDPVNITFPGLVKPVGIEDNVEIISGSMNKNKITLMAAKGIVKGAKLSARIDASNGLVNACSVKWKESTEIVEIPSAIPINTPISPDEVKDIGALYNVNQLTKIMSMITTVLGNYKDDKIKENLDVSYNTMDPSQKTFGIFDFAPREGYTSDHVEWRQKTFFDALDTHVTNMLQVLNDPNMTISIIGRDDIIRKITPTEYTYQTPSSIGPVDLTYTRTVVTSDKRVYNFISSQKLKRSDELTIILCPRNSQRIVYRIYDYQLYISNEIRNAQLHTLPAIHAYERWKFVEYQPVQGRLKILNPTGLRGENQPVMPIA